MSQTDQEDVEKVLKELFNKNPKLKAFADAKKPESRRVLNLLYSSDSSEFEKELEKHNTFFGEKLSEKDFKNLKIEDILPPNLPREGYKRNFSYFNDFDFEELPLASRLSDAQDNRRVITTWNKEKALRNREIRKKAYFSVVIDNDYVLWIDNNDTYPTYVDLPILTQAEARKIRDIFNKKGKLYYSVIPRAYAVEMGYKAVPDTMNLLQYLEVPKKPTFKEILPFLAQKSLFFKILQKRYY